MAEADSLRVAVLMGGSSAEREISLASGICVAAALEEVGHQVRAIDPAEVDLVHVDWRQFDACFIALHGGEGEDGRVQKLLDSLNVSYTGSGPQASRLAMSKVAAKDRFRAWGVSTPESVTLHSSESIQEMLARSAPLGFPLVIKPDDQGSSLGVNLVTNQDEFQRGVAEGQFYGKFLLAEKFIPGREFTLALMDDFLFPLIEIKSPAPLFTFEGKYRFGESEFDLNPELSEEQLRQVKRSAVLAARALETTGLVRVDVKLDENGQPWVLEVNTIPGMTEQSLVPRSAAFAGIEMPELCDRLLRSCLPNATR